MDTALLALRRSEGFECPLTTARIAASTAVTGGGSGIEPAAARWGPLRRRRGDGEAWVDGFYVLRPTNILYVFDSDGAMRPRCAIDCLGMSVRPMGGELGCAFELVSDCVAQGEQRHASVRPIVPARVVLHARTPATREDWMVTLRDAMRAQAGQYDSRVVPDSSGCLSVTGASFHGGGNRRSTTTLDLEGKLQRTLRSGEISRTEYEHILSVHAGSRATEEAPSSEGGGASTAAAFSAARTLPTTPVRRALPQPTPPVTPLLSPARTTTAPAMADLDARYLEQMLGKMNKMKCHLLSETTRRKAALAQAGAATARSESLERDVRRLAEAESSVVRKKEKVDLLLSDLRAQLQISERARRNLENELEQRAEAATSTSLFRPSSWKPSSLHGSSARRERAGGSTSGSASGSSARSSGATPVSAPSVGAGSVLRQSMQRKLETGLISRDEFDHMLRVAGEANHIDKLEARLQQYEMQESSSDEEEDMQGGSSAGALSGSGTPRSRRGSSGDPNARAVAQEQSGAAAEADDTFGSNQAYVDSLHHMIKTTNQKWYARWKKATDRVAELELIVTESEAAAESVAAASSVEAAGDATGDEDGRGAGDAPSPSGRSGGVCASERVALATEIERVQELALRYETMLNAVAEGKKSKKKKKKKSRPVNIEER